MISWLRSFLCNLIAAALVWSIGSDLMTVQVVVMNDYACSRAAISLPVIDSNVSKE